MDKAMSETCPRCGSRRYENDHLFRDDAVFDCRSHIVPNGHLIRHKECYKRECKKLAAEVERLKVANETKDQIALSERTNAASLRVEIDQMGDKIRAKDARISELEKLVAELKNLIANGIRGRGCIYDISQKA